MVLATRLMSCRTDDSRSGAPILPWKYLLATMLVAVCDQVLGASTSSWRKMVTPFSFPISATRFSHSTASKGDFFPSVKYREKARPFPVRAVFSAAASVVCEFPLNACFTVAICPSRALDPATVRGTLLFYSPASSRAPRFASGSGLKLAQLDSGLRERRQRKKDDCRAVVSPRASNANAPPSAGNPHAASRQVLRHLRAR